MSFNMLSFISVIETIISVRRSSDQSSNVPSTIERANKCRLPEIRVLSIVLIVML